MDARTTNRRAVSPVMKAWRTAEKLSSSDKLELIALLAGSMKPAVAEHEEYDITKTAGYREAMDDVKHGRVYHAESVDDMFLQILGEEEYSKISSCHV